MLKSIFIIGMLCLMNLPVYAQISKSAHSDGIYKVTSTIRSKDQQQSVDSDTFLDPARSLLKVGRQAAIQFFPADFVPRAETETDPLRRSSLRYAVIYYRNCQIVGFDKPQDVMLGARIDTRDGVPIIRYYFQYSVINPDRVQFQEGRMAIAILPGAEGSALLFYKDEEKQQLVSFEGIFEDPHTVNLLSLTDLEGISTDDRVGKFAIFVRGGESRASLFLINTDTTLTEVQSFELIKNLSTNDRAYIFAIIPESSLPVTAPYRGTIVK